MISKQERLARLQEIKKLAEAGVTYAEIGVQFGISKQRVQQIVAKNKIQKKNNEDFLREDRKRTWEAWFEQGYTIRDIAEFEGLTYSYVSQYCIKNGFKKPVKQKDIHGTTSCYNAGCRCDECKRANRKDHARLKFQPVPNHGLSGYVNYGCCCNICKAAKQKENKAARERRKARKAQEQNKES